MSNITQLKVVSCPTPHTLNGKVPPRRVKNAVLRSREYLTNDEVERVMDAAGKIGRHGHRDRTLVMIAFRHALRVSELVCPALGSSRLKAGNSARQPSQEWIPQYSPHSGSRDPCPATSAAGLP